MPDTADLTYAPLDVDEELVENVRALIEDGQAAMVRTLAVDLHPADLAQLMSHLPPEQSQTLLGWLPTERGGLVLPELESAYRADLLDEVSPAELVALIDEIDTDDAADVIADLPADVFARVLPQLEDRAEVEHLLGYDEETAGGLMEVDYVVVNEDATVAEATEAVRACAEEVDQVYAVYVVDAQRRLQGIVPLKRLLLAREGRPVRDLMITDIVTTEPDEDQEEVARLMERYDLIALPVVSADGVLLGRITIDDIVDVIRDEAEEDLQRASGIAGDEELSASVLQITRGRLGWLLLGLVGAFLSGLVIKGFEGSLERATVLAVFIPVVMAMAGNAGIQSAAIAVQGLASGDLWGSDLLRRLGKELVVATLNGVVLAVVLGVAVLVLPGFAEGAGGALAATVALSLFLVVIIATGIGATVPLLLAKAGIDPALAMGPRGRARAPPWLRVLPLLPRRS
ncbi:MAG: magnesium transporter, partial [Bacteroidota bacterium]